MRFPRFRLRTLMIAVAAAAVALWAHATAERLRGLTLDYELRALDHGFGETLHAYAAEFDGCILSCRGIVPSRANPRLDRNLAAYHGAMKRKYERAARYPWLPVSPDPPPPS